MGPQLQYPQKLKVFVYLLIFRNILGLEFVVDKGLFYLFYSTCTLKWTIPQIKKDLMGVSFLILSCEVTMQR